VSDTDPIRKPWTLLAYTVADDRSESGSLDASVKNELKEICDAADFGELSIAAQVDFKHTRGVFRASLTTEPPKGRGFEDVDPTITRCGERFATRPRIRSCASR
jgi:hypothetical protein